MTSYSLRYLAATFYFLRFVSGPFAPNRKRRGEITGSPSRCITGSIRLTKLKSGALGMTGYEHTCRTGMTGDFGDYDVIMATMTSSGLTSSGL